MLDPVIVTAYAPADPEQERVELAFGVVVLTATLVGERLQVKPVDGETATESVTVPENPSRLLTALVDVPMVPARTVTLASEGTILKS